MTQLTTLKTATTLHDIAALLGFKASAVAYILYKLPGANKYIKFDIPKRYGGTREISAPIPELKLLQRRLSDCLQNCVEEINKAEGREDRIAHGFKRKHSIMTNARQHRNRRFVFNIDLEDFFGSINFGRVRGFFIKDRNYALRAEIATFLAQIACYQNSLPQGSPCSPIISNLIGHVLDIHLVKLASKVGCTYSRYADDLTFSTNERVFPTQIAVKVRDSENEWSPGGELQRLVAKSGFEINPLKTRMQYRDSRQEVTGLVVNRKVNVRAEYRHTVRAMVHRLCTKGTFEFVTKVKRVDGTIAVSKTVGTTKQLHGMLGFIYGVDRYNQTLTLDKERQRFAKKELVYRRFLLFKDFYATPSPVIICEGKTDNVYILCAIRSLVATYPELATQNANGSIKWNVRIYKYSGTSTGRILGINGGSSDLGILIQRYKAESERFKAPGRMHPVILLIDNDSGAKPIYNIAKQITGTKPLGTESFVHVTGNLYLVATPLKPGVKESSIEDFFSADIKAKTIGGKKFDPKNDFDTATHYGKIVFAYKVVKPQADKIDFGAFKPILSTVVSVIKSHAKRYPP